MQNSLFSKYVLEQSERSLPRLLKEGREQPSQVILMELTLNTKEPTLICSSFMTLMISRSFIYEPYTWKAS